MDFAVVSAFASFSFVMSITPGPNNMMLLASGAAFGFRRTLPHLLGAAWGVGVMLGAVTLGLGGLLALYPRLLDAVRLVGGLWLLWLAWTIGAPALRSPSAASQDVAQTPRGSRPMTWLEAALFQWVNPKAWSIVIGASGAFAGMAPTALTQAASMTLVFMAVAPFCSGSWVLAGSSLRRLLAGKSGRPFTLAMAGLIAASALLVLIG